MDIQQVELLKELFNLGVGNASASIGEIANCEVHLSVPRVRVSRLGDIIKEIEELEGATLSAIAQEYSGPFEGTVMMIYSEEASLSLVRLIMGSDASAEQLSEMETDALCEIGNIVLNACLSTVGNLCKAEIETSLPFILSGGTEDVLTMGGKLNREKSVIFLKMGFKVEKGDLQGYISFLLDTDKLRKLIDSLDNFFKTMTAVS